MVDTEPIPSRNVAPSRMPERRIEGDHASRWTLDRDRRGLDERRVGAFATLMGTRHDHRAPALTGEIGYGKKGVN